MTPEQETHGQGSKARHAANRLVNETSPYLLQHAHNPVYWYPWSDEALERARRENKPVLLSVGYSACHWCHVMAHESFEDGETAALMNQHFINIKVDREERPDIDRIYQNAQYLLTRRGGGWPLTMFIDPEDQVPFFGGTYFPPEPRHGLPGFRELLTQIAAVYEKDRAGIRKQAGAFMQALTDMEDAGGVVEDELHDGVITNAFRALAGQYDLQYGGFGGAPKFPQAPVLALLAEGPARQQTELAETAGRMLEHTLVNMARGGLYDHLGGGFARYCVDNDWQIPHFEKMLYDNGQLLGLYARLATSRDDDFLRSITAGTADWLLREMRGPDGGFCSSIDADSEGEEGRYYVWSREELTDILLPEEYDLFTRRYGVDTPPNFEGRWHLRINRGLDEIAEETAETLEQLGARLATARQKALARRGTRVPPGRDDKILTSWNALAIQGLAEAGIRLDRPDLIDAAAEALEFTRRTLWRDGRLIASYKDGRGHLNAYLDDYAFLIDAILTLLQARWNTAWLTFAMDLAAVLLNQFRDEVEGGFFFTSHDHPRLLQRRKDYMDDATPSGNGIAARALQGLGHLTGIVDYLDASEATLRAAWPGMLRAPYAHASLMRALHDFLDPPAQVIIRGDDEARVWQQACLSAAGDARIAIYAIPADAGPLPGQLDEYHSTGMTTAWLCRGRLCRPPQTQLETLISDLKLQPPG